MNSDQFVELLSKEFPSLRSELGNWPGLIHLQSSQFARFTQEAINCGNELLVRRCFDIADTCLEKSDSELENAISVSYLEHLDLDSAEGYRAKDTMPRNLFQAWESIMRYLDDLAQNE